MSAEWVALSAESRDYPGDEWDAATPWFPYLFFDSFGAALDIWFETEDACNEFIRTTLESKP